MLEGRERAVYKTYLEEAPVLTGIFDLFHGGCLLVTIKLLHVNHWELHLSLIFLLLFEVFEGMLNWLLLSDTKG